MMMKKPAKWRMANSLLFTARQRLWLTNERGRTMLTYLCDSKKLCVIAIDEAHVIKQ
ncbi:hypothetical protein QZH41_018496 [Actinostola sp. cb2023]|nr:hypothetical protein QZH41_018496 [Actinostola sp. cb2023]